MSGATSFDALGREAERLSPVCRALPRVAPAALMPASALELLNEGMERAVAMIGRALVAKPPRAASSATSSASQARRVRDLPMPASPEISTHLAVDLPRPGADRASKFGSSRPRDRRSRSSRAGMRRRRSDSRSADTPSAAQASTGSARPLTSCRPRSCRPEPVQSSRRVAAERDAARLGQVLEPLRRDSACRRRQPAPARSLAPRSRRRRRRQLQFRPAPRVSRPRGFANPLRLRRFRAPHGPPVRRRPHARGETPK